VQHEEDRLSQREARELGRLLQHDLAQCVEDYEAGKHRGAMHAAWAAVGVATQAAPSPS
jgi:hypothetical protein